MIGLSLKTAPLVNDRGHETFAMALSSANGSRKNRLSDYAICHEQLIRQSTEQALGSIVFKLNEDDDDRDFPCSLMRPGHRQQLCLPPLGRRTTWSVCGAILGAEFARR